VEPRAGVQYRHILEQFGHKLFGLNIIAARLMQGIGPGRQIVPAGAAGRFRVRVMTETPGFTGSPQFLIFFGLPLRTRKTMVEV
jgi:hypothetical protein